MEYKVKKRRLLKKYISSKNPVSVNLIFGDTIGKGGPLKNKYITVALTI